MIIFISPELPRHFGTRVCIYALVMILTAVVYYYFH